MPDIIPLIVGLIVFASSLISLSLGLSVTIIEIALGTFAGWLGLMADEWMIYMAGFGGIVLTFLAGAEVDLKLMREKMKESLLLGLFSFSAPFAGGIIFAHYFAGWGWQASLIAGIALSETSIAVVYSVLVETKLPAPAIGKLLMAATFITNTCTAIALSILFMRPNVYTLLFFIVSIAVIFLAVRFSHHVFDVPGLKNKVIEPEIKYIFLLLLVFIYFAKLGQGHAILPAFILGLLMSGHFAETSETRVVKSRLRTVAFAIITPLFFIVAGLKVSLPVIASSFGLFLAFFAVKQISKFFGVYFLARKYIPDGEVYVTLLMSTGLTFGLIAIVYGLNSGFIDQDKYSVLTGVLIASAVIPTFIAQKWFMPKHSEDMPE